MSDIQAEILILTEDAAEDAAINTKPDGELANASIFTRALHFT